MVEAKKAPVRDDKLPSDAVASEPSAANAQRLVQKLMDEGNAKGFIGPDDKNDAAPNEHYTVQGVGAGLPTPENQPPKNRS
jgi:hypothetical protein